MKTYGRKKTRTKSTTRQERLLILALVGVLLILLLVPSNSGSGQSQDSVRTVSQRLPQTVVLEEEEEPEELFSDYDAELIAKTIWGEARGCSPEEQRLVAWCILNRVDTGIWGDTIEDVIKYPNAFQGYDINNPTTYKCLELAKEVLIEWTSGGECEVLAPYATEPGYLYFVGRDGHNWFREEW